MFLLLSSPLVLMLAGTVSTAPPPLNRSTTEADHNWKFSFPSASSSNYIKATSTLGIDLNAVTVSLWVKDTKVNTYNTASGYVYSAGDLLTIFRSSGNLYFYIKGTRVYCSSCISTDTSLKHILVSWSGALTTNGHASIWVNGARVFSSTSFQRSQVIPRGLQLLLGQYTGSSSPYAFTGELAYVNVYPVYVGTAAEVAKLSKAATSDPEAVIPWSSFIRGAHGDVILYPEYDIYASSFIQVSCRENNMTLTLVRSAFPHLQPARAALKDHKCKASFNDTLVTFTTPLGQCGTTLSYESSTATYSNYIVADTVNPAVHSSAASTTLHAVINRGALSLDQTSLKFHCAYPLVPHQTIPAYSIRTTNMEVEGTGQRDFAFEVKLYHDLSYSHQYLEREYPLHADTQERIYAAAVLVTGGEERMGIWIDRCVMTPDADVDYVTRHELITEGCPVDETVQYHNSTDVQQQRFSFEAFRFNSRPTAVVYMHCYIDICQAGDKTSRCTEGLSTCPN